MDELTVVQDFVSDDYFTSDSTKESFKAKALELRKEWEQEASDAEAEGRTLSTPLSAWSGARQKLQKRLVSLTEGLGEGKTWNDEDADEVVRFDYELLDLLGYSAGYDIVTGRNHDGTESSYQDVHGTATTEDSTPLLVVFATPVDDIAALLDKEASTLLRPIIQTLPGSTEKLERTDSVARYLSKRFVEDNPPSFALVLAGSTMLLTAAERWQEGRYLAIDLGLLFERNDTKRGGAVDQFLACTSAQALAPTAEGTTWFSGVLDDSVKHTEKVSEDLREAVQKSIEIIANEVVIRRRRENLDPLPADEAQVLAKQSLRFLYRILFLLFAEASPELDVVPVGSTEYESGYSLDRLRDLALVDIPTRRDGTHLYQSLNVLFTQIQSGHNDLRIAEAADRSHEAVPMSEGLVFHPLEADLFSRKATAHIDEVGLGNDALQQVLQKLLLSKESAKKARGFISYAELGINQLGRVYEGLMSYTGFFAETDLFEVAPKGDSSKGSWVVPTDRADHIDADDFVCEFAEASGEYAPVRHTKGSFVFRLSGRDRQQSASYYTPEVLTRFTVSQALAELLTDDMSADGILRLTVCEPALGSGAFALEAVNQLALEYLRRKQDELGEAIDPATYQQELQKTKAYIALHNVYGVDLNSTAVELAEISLWLDTMVADLSAPWFGLRLRRGNSLIGARRSVYGRSTVKDKTWLKSTPQKVDSDERDGQSIYQFLLPAEGWGAAADAKEGKALAPEAVARLKTWRKSQRVKLSNPQIGRLVGLSKQADVLWEIALKRLTIAEAETRRTINVWGLEELEAGTTITRAEIEAKLADPNGAYQRLRRVMDAWCALWFWPLTETDIEPPSVEQWIDACEQLLGKPEGDVKSRSTSRVAGQASMFDVDNWSELNEYEGNQRAISGAASTVEKVLDEHPWLRITEAIAEQQGFFHWELDFATVFQRGGFDLQLGNPPWVRPDWSEADILGDFDVAFALETKMPVERWQRLKTEALSHESNFSTYIEQASYNAGNRAYLSDRSTYPVIAGLRTDLYRCFMEQTWGHQTGGGIVALIHPETHFTDDKAQLLRRETYSRLKRHWQFINELQLFEIHNLVAYGVHIYSEGGQKPRFLMASSLYHPDTVERSLKHNGEGAEPGLKDSEGNWDLRPHSSRILTIGQSQLEAWRLALGNDKGLSALETSMIYAVNSSASEVLEKLSHAPRISDFEPKFSQGWNETTDFNNGRFDKRWGVPDSGKDVILQGPNFHVSVPFYKTPNPAMKSNKDWSEVDLEGLAGDAVPVTSYKPIRDGKYDQLYTHWTLPNGDRVAARDYFRVSWRNMAANTGERTLIPAIIPPGTAHIHGVTSLGFPDGSMADLTFVTGVLSSLLSDFSIRVAPKSTISGESIGRIALDKSFGLRDQIESRALLLNALTEGYADLWNSLSDLTSDGQAWTGGYGYPDSVSMDVLDYEWSESSPLRLAADRRQAQVEIDALVALMLGVSADELCSIYRTQFPVLYKYDTQRDHFDRNGRIVPADVLKVWQKLGDSADEDDLSATNAQGFEYAYAPPFRTLDREADMRTAYAEFEQRLAEKEQTVLGTSNNQGAAS